ncbi:MAG: response regulator [Gammaproteobacteria bacterium]|nr:response regulator [Gammaproteobacteria bacterium]
MNEFESIDILYAEDSPTDAEVTLRALKKANVTNNLVWVKDGQEALTVLLGTGADAGHKKSRPHLVLLDLKMPKVDGLEVLRIIRSTDALRALPVVLLTSSSEERDLVESYKLGVNSYIVKPIDFSALSVVVAQLGYYWMAINRVPCQAR